MKLRRDGQERVNGVEATRRRPLVLCTASTMNRCMHDIPGTWRLRNRRPRGGRIGVWAVRGLGETGGVQGEKSVRKKLSVGGFVVAALR